MCVGVGIWVGPAGFISAILLPIVGREYQYGHHKVVATEAMAEFVQSENDIGNEGRLENRCNGPSDSACI